MRHQVAGKKLSRGKDERTALRRILIAQLFDHERIETTQAKALAIRGQAERLITLAKHGIKEGDAKMVHARRLAAARLSNPKAVVKLFDDIAPRYAERLGGYTRIHKLGPRLGDNAEMVLIELIEE
ncbi:MAG: 50S ribosomal protein L17 [Chloroflexi bacterium RBG_19FT_COMBO_50_10]|nr:MAG: 50S ribosomal protein L17 [Chloroflexi bacterium RBG_16_47_49]OGO62351.1 MAG: 50S ribosomal protein L17 [Chloroflexi bacterium RBG_19FT_COMBO_50_10]